MRDEERNVGGHVKRCIPHPSSLILLLALSFPINAQSVRITEKPQGLVHGILYVPIVASEPVERIALFINSVKFSEAKGRAVTVQVNVGRYLRRLRLRAVGYDAKGLEIAQDEMVVNDPRPPFRVRLQAPHEMPATGSITLGANIIKPSDLAVASVDFYVGEQRVGSATAPQVNVVP